jgi:hypothetical protein
VGNGAGLRGYAIRFEGARPEGPFHGIGLAGAPVRVQKVKGSIAADLDGDGRNEFFRDCTTSEGVYFTIWTGAPLKGSRRWHQYLYLGYDVSPTCTDADTKERRH